MSTVVYLCSKCHCESKYLQQQFRVLLYHKVEGSEAGGAFALGRSCGGMEPLRQDYSVQRGC